MATQPRQCPNCGSYHTFVPSRERHFWAFVVTFGLWAVVYIPWRFWLDHKGVEPGWRCKACNYFWVPRTP